MSVAEPAHGNLPLEGRDPAGANRPDAAGAAGAAGGSQPQMPSPMEFLGALSSGLRAPMNRITSLARLMGEAGLPPAQQRVARQICDSAEAMLMLVHDALDFIRSGPLEPAVHDFDLRLLTNETGDRLRVRAGEKRVSLECRVHHQVPSRLVGDAGRLRQVLWNLVDHAIDAREPHGLVLRVGRLHEDHDTVTVRFDLRSYHLSQMGGLGHERGAAGEPPVPRTPGAPETASGFKLSIARRLAGSMGGAVYLEGSAEAMEHAWLDLTFRKQPELPVEGVSAPLREPLAGTRVLVLDAKEPMRRSLVERLEAWGCRPTAVADPEQATARLQEAAKAADPFGFVLIDRDLPEGSGEEMGPRIRAAAGSPGPQLVLLADVGCRGDLERARECGFGAYLSRPLDGRDLAEAMIEMRHLATAAGGDRPLVTRHWLAETRRTRTRILIVEDDIVSALVTDWTLRRMGYQVQRVGSAAEVRQLRAGGASWFDLVVLSLRLPDADGVSLVRELHGTSPGGRETAVLVIGQAGTRSERDRCEAAGVNAYIASPVDLEHLCQMVEQITSTDRMRGSDAGDPAADGASRLTVRQRAQALGMLTFEFDVDPETGRVLSRGDGLGPLPGAVPDALLVGSMEELAHEEGVAGAAGAEAPAERMGTALRGAEPAAPGHRLDGEDVAEAPVERPDGGEPSAAEPASARPARPGRGEASPIIDLEQLDRAAMGDVAARADVLGVFVGRARAGLARLSQALAAADAPRVEAEAARVARMAEVVGATACAEVFTALRCSGSGSAQAAPLLTEASNSVTRIERIMGLLTQVPPPDRHAA